MTGLPAPFATALVDQRERLNAAFALRVRGGARIDPQAFLAHFRDVASPLVSLVHSTWPERTAGVVTALYDATLDLFASGLVGPDARHPLIERVWTDLLPQAVRLLAREPQAVIGCLCNAAVNISQQRGSRPDVWCTRMQQVLPHCESLRHLLEAGKVATWQAGLAQYRTAALEAADGLPPALAACALGLDPGTPPQTLATALSRLRNNLWLTSRAALHDENPATLRCVAQAGAFSGFGGVFARPPVVGSSDGRLVAFDGQSQWELFADAYGQWFRRLGEGHAPKSKAKPSGIALDATGTLRWGELSIRQSHLANPTGLACDGTTLAVSIATSHHVFLFAR